MATAGSLANVVCWVATVFNLEKSMSPAPEKVNEEVCKSFCSGNRKTNEQVFPASFAGISKLNSDEMVEVTSPKYEVPYAWVGEAELTGTIKCGYSKLFKAYPQDGAAGLGAAQPFAVRVTVTHLA